MYQSYQKFPNRNSDKEPVCQCRTHKRRRFNPWIRKISWRRAWQLILVFLPGNPMDREAWRLQSVQSQRIRHNWSNLACPHPSDWLQNLCYENHELWFRSFFYIGKSILVILKTNENGSNFWPHITYHHWFTHCPCHHEVLRLQDHINSVLTIIICIKRSVNSQEICYHKFSLKSIIWNYFSLILSFLFFFFLNRLETYSSSM